MQTLFSEVTRLHELKAINVKRGYHLANLSVSDIAYHAEDEIWELIDALDHEPEANQLNEIADVFCCLFGIMVLSGWSIADVEKAGMAKLALRFAIPNS